MFFIGPSYLFQRNNMLFVVFLLVDDYVAVDKQVVEEEELPGLGLLPAGLRQDTLTHQHSPCTLMH